MIDIAKAKLDPASYFEEPQDVLEQKELSKDEKIAILKRWQYDVHEIMVAEEENMTTENGGLSEVLDEIIKSLHKLGAKVELDHNPTTKQGGGE